MGDLNYQRSDNLDALAQALAKAQGEIEAAAKDKKNPHFKSSYADLSSVWEVARAPLTKNGIAVLQPVTAEGRTVSVTTLLLHSSGQWMSATLALSARNDTPQDVGSAITYGRRYGLASMIGVVADADDDGNAASGRGDRDDEPPRGDNRGTFQRPQSTPPPRPPTQSAPRAPDTDPGGDAPEDVAAEIALAKSTQDLGRVKWPPALEPQVVKKVAEFLSAEGLSRDTFSGIGAFIKGNLSEAAQGEIRGLYMQVRDRFTPPKQQKGAA